MKKIILPFLAFVNICMANAQPAIQWQICLGGTNVEDAYSIQQTADGGYIVAGSTDSNDGDVTGNHGNGDYWIVKLDGSGILQWQKCLGGTNQESASSIQQTADGGYIVAGRSNSNNGDVSGNHGLLDYWIVKLDGSGILQWQKCLGGTNQDGAMSIRQTSDGGYIVSGNTYSNDGDVSGNHGNSDYWVVKLDSTGNIQWQKCLGGSLNDNGTSIEQTADGGYIVAGITSSNDGDITGFHGIQDYWVVKLDVTGIIQWQKCLGGTNQDQATSIWQTSDGGFTVAGVVGSNDGDVTGNHGAEDYWVVKLDGSGTLVWQQCLGGTDGEVAISIQQTADSSYIVAGYTWSNDGNVTGNHGLDDYWVVKLDISGNLLWQKCLGGTIQDYGGFIQQTVDGGYIIAGSTLSNDGDVTGNHGNHDYWVVKLSALTSIEEYKTPELRVFPNPVRSILTILLPGKEEFIIQIIDLFGKLIYSEKTNSTQINLDMTNFPEGDYFLKMQTENTSVTNIISVIK